MANRQPTFNQRQMDLLLPDILAHLHRLTNHTEQLENALTLVLSSINFVQSQTVNQSRLISELHARPSTTSVDRDVMLEVAQEHLLPILRSDMVSTVRTVAATVMTHMLSTLVRDTQALPPRQFATVSTLTDDLPPTTERNMMSSAIQTNDSDVVAMPIAPTSGRDMMSSAIQTDDNDVVAMPIEPTSGRTLISSPTQPDDNNVVAMSIAPGIEPPHVPCENSEIARDGSVEPGDVSLPAPTEHHRLSHDQCFPTSELRALDGEALEDLPLVGQGLAHSET